MNFQKMDSKNLFKLREPQRKWEKELRRRRKARRRRQIESERKQWLCGRIVKAKKGNYRHAVKYPSILCLRNNLTEINSFLSDVRNKVFKLRINSLTIDHSTVTSATPECVLYLISEIWTILSISDGLVIRPFGNSKNPDVEDIFNGSGYNDYFSSHRAYSSSKKLRQSLLYNDRIYIKHEKGLKVDTEVASNFVKEFAEALGFSSKRTERLKVSLGECIMNVVNHAYPRKLKIERRNPVEHFTKYWWVMGYTEKKTGKAYFVIMDRGVGMAQTISDKKWSEWFGDQLQFIGMLSKSQQIQKAFERPSSSTKSDGRGLGLPTLRRYAQEALSGELYVISRKSVLRFGKGINHCEDFKEEFDGTMLVWEVDAGAA